jgi:hypothetical protein
MNIVKPFSIANYAQKNSIALAYLAKVQHAERNNSIAENRTKNTLLLAQEQTQEEKKS